MALEVGEIIFIIFKIYVWCLVFLLHGTKRFAPRPKGCLNLFIFDNFILLYVPPHTILYEGERNNVLSVNSIVFKKRKGN